MAEHASDVKVQPCLLLEEEQAESERFTIWPSVVT